MRALDIAATGMVAQQRNVEVVSNNLANMNTTAYMRRRTEFHDLLYQNIVRVGSTSSEAGTVVPSGAQLGLGVKLAAVYRIHEQGNLSATDNTFDMAIQGNGFFQITRPSGETRLHPGRHLPAQRQRPDRDPRRLHPVAGDHRPQQRRRCHHQFQRPDAGQNRGPGDPAERRPAPGRRLPQTIRASKPSAATFCWKPRLRGRR